jgi:hypothetical protein
MAVITLTEILGGDNIAGSRITINDNFKRVSNAINTLETRLDTSFTPGGSLNVGNALIRRYTNPTTAQIFDCEATALIQGNLNVLLDIGVSQSASVALDTTIGRNVNFTGSAVGGPWSFTSGIRSTFTNEITNQQLYQGTTGAPAINLQSLAGSGTVRQITSVIGHSVLRVDLSTYNGTAPNDCEGIILPTVASSTPGQILTVIIDGAAGALLASGNFQISATNFAPGAVNAVNGIRMSDVTPTTSNDVRKLAVTLFADASGWRVLSITQSTAGDITY